MCTNVNDITGDFPRKYDRFGKLVNNLPVLGEIIKSCCVDNYLADAISFAYFWCFLGSILSLGSLSVSVVVRGTDCSFLTLLRVKTTDIVVSLCLCHDNVPKGSTYRLKYLQKLLFDLYLFLVHLWWELIINLFHPLAHALLGIYQLKVQLCQKNEITCITKVQVTGPKMDDFLCEKQSLFLVLLVHLIRLFKTVPPVKVSFSVLVCLVFV